MRPAATSVVFALSLAACTSMGSTSNKVMVLNPELRTANADYTASMTAPRTPMTTASGAVVASCTDYLALQNRIDVAAFPDNRTASLEYVVCDSLSVLQDALPVAAADVSAEIGAALATRLDLRSFRSSRHQRTSDEAFTLQALVDHPLEIGPYTTELDSPGWYFKLEAAAVADINGNGQADWLIWVVDQSREGTYLAVEPLLILDPGAHGLLEASPLPR